MHLASNLKKLRHRLGDSQEEFGKRLGFGRSVIGKWETGLSEPTVAVLLALEDLAGVPFRRLANEPLADGDFLLDGSPAKDLVAELADLKGRVEVLEKSAR